MRASYSETWPDPPARLNLGASHNDQGQLNAMHERPTGRERARERRHRSIGPIDFARVHEAAERSGGIQILGPPPLAAAAAEGVAPVSAQSASLVGFSERPELPALRGRVSSVDLPCFHRSPQ